MSIPETRASLILRLSDPTDSAAWEEFVAIYQPLVFRLGRRKGMQPADAQELVQEVMLAISRSVAGWVPDRDRGRFRDWLYRIARNLMTNFLTRRKYQNWGTGDSRVAELIQQQPDPACEEATLYDLEFRRELFHQVAEQVKSEVTEKTWDAFRLSCIEEIPIRDVAERLGMSVGSIYIARSRVIFRLREKVAAYEDLSKGAKK